MNDDNKKTHNNNKTVFVTVGSTKFEKLIDTVLSSRVLRLLCNYSFRKLILQCGNGDHEDAFVRKLNETDSGVIRFVKENVDIVAYKYKSSLRDDLTSADLVISHAGSASIIESLEAGKKLIVVCNESLMDNHQFELAEKMFELGFLLYTTCSHLEDKINLIANDEFQLKSYAPGDPNLFGRFLNNII